jgi:acyl-[acyl-carrier-protein]-phospholipid O-acyltransferase/long-chain-fatty-acid--[acyl-carrier-protein] ligase
MAEYLQKGRLVLFPEGASLARRADEAFDGTGFLIHRTGPKVITAYIRGGPRLPFSRNPGVKQWFPKLSVHFSDQQPAPSIQHASATVARTRLTDWLRDRMVAQQFETEMEFGQKNLPAAILATARLMPGRAILQDATMQELSYRRLLTAVELLARQWKSVLRNGRKKIGVLLPNVNAMPVVTLSLWAAGKTPAILNYTTGPSVMAACARVAGLKRVITSKGFVTRSRLDVKPLEEAGLVIIFLE